MSKYSNLIHKEVIVNVKEGSNIVFFRLIRALYDVEMVLGFKRHSPEEQFKISFFSDLPRTTGTIPFELIELDNIEYRNEILNAANNNDWNKVANLILYSGTVAIEKIESIVRF